MNKFFGILFFIGAIAWFVNAINVLNGHELSTFSAFVACIITALFLANAAYKGLNEK